ncbi:RdRP-domain-containing protein [Rhizodiscina lignyota]|uniref:RdRP-domain-containing protein n=1 Tax=Rhizodiscina lignyota TaxID=1504668 RepID=A0A9P4IKC2_9PEZI|nr:RdRP-domain-containing protein [Rhizodiscina lignyota]
MSKLRFPVSTLQKEILANDTKWEFTVPNLPRADKLDDAGLVKSIQLVSSLSKQGIQLRLENAPSTRVTRSDPLHRFMLLSFADFRLREPKLNPNDPLRLAPGRDSADYIARLLKTGIILNGVRYHFFGHSNSQLKSRSCFMFAATKQEISVKVEAMGDFSKLKSVGKKAKRIGLLFSSADMALELSPNRCEDIDDITSGDYMFTDGCGRISATLARQLVQRRNIAFRNKRYLPSVFQIRYRGYKGVLTLCPELKGQTQVQFRASMKKFSDAKDLSLSVVEYSKPYAFGYLNDEVVLLLNSLGVAVETILQKQDTYLQFLHKAVQGDNRAAFQFLSYLNRLDLAERLLIDGVPSVHRDLRGLIKQEHARMLNKYNEQRCRILIPQSRLLFGICDPSGEPGTNGILKPGTCFVRTTLDGDGRAMTIMNTEVMVTRNPCLHPGDLQKFKAVDVPEFAHLIDCIVFPTCGKRPSADLMSGGDLDGDKFFVTWDPDIIPRLISQPALYPGVKEPISFNQITDDDRAEFFARYTNASLGRVKNLYLKWARLKGPLSPECQQLNRLFSQCVDGNRIRVPVNLEDPPEPPQTSPPFILDVLHAAAKEKIEAETASNLSCLDYEVDAMDLLLSRDRIAVSEFELIQMTLRWCTRNNADITEFAPFFDFSKLSDEQQIWMLGTLPSSKQLPSLVRNGLLQSSLLEPAELSRFKLDHHALHWKPVFSSATERMGQFLHSACRSLEVFHKKLIILQPDERLTLAIYVPQKIPKASEVQVDASVRVLAFPQSQGSQSVHYRATPTKVNFRLYCDESTFQLYELKRGNTFVYLTRSQSDESSHRNIKNNGDRRRQRHQTVEEGVNFDCRASVALQKIGKDIQTHVGRMNRAGILAAEIFVISNRDVKSMQLLDQWLHYVDTDEVLPLFEQQQKEYRIPSIKDVDWAELDPSVAEIMRDHNLSKFQHLTSINTIFDILTLLKDLDEKTRLREIYTHLLDNRPNSAIPQNKVVSSLLTFLPNVVYLVPLFFKSQTWAAHKDSLEDDLVHTAPLLLRQLILAANSHQAFIRDPILILLRELKHMSMQDLSGIVQLVALSVQDPETALDILLECIEPETSRILIGRLPVIQQFVKSIIGIAIDHIDEATSASKTSRVYLDLIPDGLDEGFGVVKATVRIDSPVHALRAGDHVRLRASDPPQNAPISKPYSMDAIVINSELGSARFRCLHNIPSYAKECSWIPTHCGSFVTSKAMFDAVTVFYAGKTANCKLYASLVGLQENQIEFTGGKLDIKYSDALNESQNTALAAALTNPLSFLWGPPGTGKTKTIVAILKELLIQLPHKRFLVTAPTHNAVDNILQRFIMEQGPELTGVKPLRVSTTLSKVSSTLREFTCDAMVGKEISNSFSGYKLAQKRVEESRLVFTTCVGAALGLLRQELFDVVLIDEASQQTEPASLIPLTKGCSRAILVGDHVQLRATVQKHAAVVDYHISLFERHYGMPERPECTQTYVLSVQQNSMRANLGQQRARKRYRSQHRNFLGQPTPARYSYSARTLRILGVSRSQMMGKSMCVDRPASSFLPRLSRQRVPQKIQLRLTRTLRSSRHTRDREKSYNRRSQNIQSPALMVIRAVKRILSSSLRCGAMFIPNSGFWTICGV